MQTIEQKREQWRIRALKRWLKNPEAMRQANRDYRRNHPEKSRAWDRKKIEKIKSDPIRLAKLRERNRLSIQRWRLDNVIPCCGDCNAIRSNKLTPEEMLAAMKAVKQVRLSKILDEVDTDPLEIEDRTYLTP